MSEPQSNDAPDSAAVLESMTLLATLSTAAEVREGVRDRRMGRDPAAQTPSDVARVRLDDARTRLLDVLMQIMLGQVPLAREGVPEAAAAVRTFDLLVKVRRVERLTQSMHQHLLSLYPEVSEELVEEARHVHDRVAALLDAEPADTGLPGLPDVVERGLSFAVWVRHET